MTHETLVVSFQFELCIPIIYSLVTLLSQILGLDDDKLMNEVMIGVFMYLIRSSTKAIRFDEFLIEEICS